jgi:hypothetical protein
MLEDLSQHILDIAENSSGAGASFVTIEVSEDVRANVLAMTVEDNGCGMSPEFLAKVTDPFTTTRTARRVGMGLPFLKQSSEMCGGEFSISSERGKGTRTRATFARDSIDRPPLGDIPAAVMAIFMGHTEIDWTYRHIYNDKEFEITTLELVEALEDRELLNTVDVGLWIRGAVSEGLAELITDSDGKSGE